VLPEVTLFIRKPGKAAFFEHLITAFLHFGAVFLTLRLHCAGQSVYRPWSGSPQIWLIIHS
jgi:hypothetical protein